MIQKVNSKIKKNLINTFKKPNKILLFMSRLDHQKGLIELITAWEKLALSGRNYRLVVINSRIWDFKKNCHYLMQINPTQELFLMGHYLVKKKIYSSKCKGFILPSYNEGLPISVLEALSFKTTCLISENCNIKNLIDSNISLKINITKKIII